MIEIDFFLNHVRLFRSMTGLSLDAGADADHSLHLALLVEEMDEFIAAESNADRADALADIVTIVCGYLLDAGDHCRVNAAGIATSERARSSLRPWRVSVRRALLA